VGSRAPTFHATSFQQYHCGGQPDPIRHPLTSPTHPPSYWVQFPGPGTIRLARIWLACTHLAGLHASGWLARIRLACTHLAGLHASGSHASLNGSHQRLATVRISTLYQWLVTARCGAWARVRGERGQPCRAYRGSSRLPLQLNSTSKWPSGKCSR
jgi:hypothetical protein